MVMFRPEERRRYPRVERRWSLPGRRVEEVDACVCVCVGGWIGASVIESEGLRSAVGT